MATSNAAIARALLSKPQTANYLGISTRTLDRMASAGIIRPVRVTRGTLRYRRCELDEYIATLDHDRGQMPGV